MPEDADPKPNIAEPIRCDCHGRGCHAYIELARFAGYVEVKTWPRQAGQAHVLIIEPGKARDLAILLTEIANDAEYALRRGHEDSTRRG